MPAASVLAVDVGIVAPGNQAAGLAACIQRCLERARLQPPAIGLAVTRGPLHPTLAAAEKTGIEMGLAGHRPARLLAIEDFVSETYSASGAMQLASILASFEAGVVSGAHALATMVSHNGTVAALLVQGGPRS